MKKDKIRILFVEDVENDMEIAIHELQKEWSDFTWRRVDDRENLIMQLGQFKPDVVISDYSMPNLNGLEALEVILSMAPGIPVIMFTGSVNEETAVACMKAGATDYVLKDKIKRLPYALREALSQKEINLAREQAEKALRENTERYSTFLNSTNDLVFLKDQEFRYLLTNKSYQQLLGKSDQEIIGHTDFEILGENEAANCRKSDER
jgi:DNA-binding NtrC family response regulator